MSCYIVPLVEAAVVSVCRKAGVKSGFIGRHLASLELMLWGGSVMLIVDHIFIFRNDLAGSRYISKAHSSSSLPLKKERGGPMSKPTGPDPPCRLANDRYIIRQYRGKSKGIGRPSTCHFPAFVAK